LGFGGEAQEAPSAERFSSACSKAKQSQVVIARSLRRAAELLLATQHATGTRRDPGPLVSCEVEVLQTAEGGIGSMSN